MMHRVLRASSGGLVAVFLVVGCGPRAELEVPRAPRASLPLGGRAVEPGAPAVPWRQKSRAERMEYMGLVFHPRMKALFDEQASPGDAPLGCQSCHGEDMVAAGYAMPNGLSPLSASAPYEDAAARDERTARFMAERVVPLLRELLGTGPSDAQPPGAGAPAGDVGCHSCHARTAE